MSVSNATKILSPDVTMRREGAGGNPGVFPCGTGRPQDVLMSNVQNVRPKRTSIGRPMRAPVRRGTQYSLPSANGLNTSRSVVLVPKLRNKLRNKVRNFNV